MNANLLRKCAWPLPASIEEKNIAKLQSLMIEGTAGAIEQTATKKVAFKELNPKLFRTVFFCTEYTVTR